MATCFMRLMFHGLDLCSSNVRPTSGGMGSTFHGVRASPEPVVATGWLGQFVAAVPPSCSARSRCTRRGRPVWTRRPWPWTSRPCSLQWHCTTVAKSRFQPWALPNSQHAYHWELLQLRHWRRRDNDDDGDDSDSTSDNYSSVITFPFSTYYCFRVSIQTIAVVPSLLIPA